MVGQWGGGVVCLSQDLRVELGGQLSNHHRKPPLKPLGGRGTHFLLGSSLQIKCEIQDPSFPRFPELGLQGTLTAGSCE